ncbi:MAG: hypothetical protein AAF806_15790 [Bacteroidota bacterium]
MHSKIYLFLIFSVGLLLLIQCRFDGKTNIKTYYYPMHELYDGLTYEYRGINNEQLPPYYWYYRTVEQGESTYLTGMYYDYNFIPQQFIREERVSNGMLMDELFIYQTDSMDLQIQIPVDIIAGNAFPFEVQDSLGVFWYEITWFSPVDSSINTIARNRIYKGKTTFEFKGKNYNAIEFSVRELIENEQEGVLKIELEGKEIYAQGLGLVYVSKKAIGSPFEQTYQLYDRYSMEKLEEKFGKSLE